MGKSIETTYGQFEIREGIMHVAFIPQSRIDVYIARQMLSTILRMQKGLSYPLCLDLSSIADIDKPARDFLAQTSSIYANAVSIYARGHVAVAVTSFYLRISIPACPTAVFADMPSAIAFLNLYRRRVT